MTPLPTCPCTDYRDLSPDERNKKISEMDNEKLDKENLEMEFLKEVKEVSHSELYKSHFTIIIPVASLKKP